MMSDNSVCTFHVTCTLHDQANQCPSYSHNSNNI